MYLGWGQMEGRAEDWSQGHSNICRWREREVERDSVFTQVGGFPGEWVSQNINEFFFKEELIRYVQSDW